MAERIFTDEADAIQKLGLTPEQAANLPESFRNQIRQLSEMEATGFDGIPGRRAASALLQSMKSTLPAVSAQTEARQEGQAALLEQQQQLQSQFQPFQQAGTGALAQQQALLGLSGPEARAQAVTELRATPEETRRREEAFLSTARGAGATGQLRGGQVLRELQRTDRGLEEEAINRRVGQFGQLSQQGLQATGAGAGFSTGLVGQQVGLGSEIGDISALGILGQQQIEQQIKQSQGGSRLGDFVGGALEFGAQVAPLVNPAIQTANVFGIGQQQ